MKYLLSFLSILILPVISQAQVQQENVTRIVKTLSSDEMKGRRAFTPEIEKAADFIAGEFEEIGLEPLAGDQDFLQSFTVESFTVKKADIRLDGKPVSLDNFFAQIDRHDFDWTQKEDIRILQITNEDDFRTRFGEINSLHEDLLIFVDPSHENVFRRYEAYFSQPSNRFPDAVAYNKVFILGESTGNFDIALQKNIERRELANVAGMIEGKRKNEIVLFSGHYDHLGVLQPVDGDSIANGANDNASGTAAVIELARLFSKRAKPERTLMFVAFTAEESGGFGSQYFSRQLDPENIVAMFNIEMIGKPATDGPNSAWITGFDKSSFGKLLQESTKGTKYTFYADPYPDQNLFYRSDNATLARLGVPAHTISTTPIDVDPDYHRVTDEIETINLAHLTNTINAIAEAAKMIISGEHTPTRVDPNRVN